MKYKLSKVYFDQSDTYSTLGNVPWDGLRDRIDFQVWENMDIDLWDKLSLQLWTNPIPLNTPIKSVSPTKNMRR
jgi:hypothetical protein